MPARVLFVVRGKLGDTLVSYATVRQYVDQFPDHDVTLLTRGNYARLLAGEPGVKVIGFSNRLTLGWHLAQLALAARFDALLVLWGFGPQIAWIGRLVRARRKVYLDRRFAPVFGEHAEVPRDALQSDPMWHVARVFAPALGRPQRLQIATLAARRSPRPGAVGIAPVADEARRVMTVHAMRSLSRAVAARHPGLAVHIYVDHRDRFARALLDAGAPDGSTFRAFPSLEDLVGEFANLAALYSTDTGLSHLATAMGVPVHVFFGPTQPWKCSMPAQPQFERHRTAVLGSGHCEVKECDRALCIEMAVAEFACVAPATPLAATPAACPLRSAA